MANVGSGEQPEETVDRLQLEVAALRRSRRRLAEAGYADRRTIERDLHDGVQQHLVALAVDLQRLARFVDLDPVAAKALLDEMAANARDALDEATALAQRVYPPLDHVGLRGAIRSAAQRVGVTCLVDIAAGAEFPSDVVAAFYWACAEALSAASAGSEATVRAHDADGSLTFDISVAPHLTEGGLDRLRDRIEALDGHVSVHHHQDGGSACSWLVAALALIRIALGEVQDDRHDALVDRRLPCQVELHEHRVDDLLDGPLGHDEVGGDGCVVLALGHLPEHIELSSGQLSDRRRRRPRPFSHQPFHDLGVDERATICDDADGVDQLIEVMDAFLQHVGSSGAAGIQERQCIARVGVVTEHDHAHARVRVPKSSGSLDSFVGMARWHSDVGDDDVRTLAFDGLKQRVEIPADRQRPRAWAPLQAGFAGPRGRGSGPRRARAGSASAEDTPMTSDLPLVLIVDDNDRNRKLVRDVLREARFRTLEAATVAAAIAMASEHLPDVILMDLRLPDGDGTDAMRALRVQPRTSHIPIVALTALLLDAHEGWAAEVGFAGSIAKPIDVDRFPDQVRRFSARRGLTRSLRTSAQAAPPRARSRDQGCQHPSRTQAGTVGPPFSSTYVLDSGCRRSAGTRAGGGLVRKGDIMRSRLVLVVAVVALAVASYAGNALATPGTGFKGTTVAKATFGQIFSHASDTTSPWDELLMTHGDSDLYVQQNTWEAGGSTGWHTHPGPSLVIVTEGSVTVYEGDDPTCTPHVYTAGSTDDSFVDIGGGDVHLVRNETAAEAQAVAIQLIPAGAERRLDADDPGNCKF